jgi:acyl-CoA thioesterase-1
LVQRLAAALVVACVASMAATGQESAGTPIKVVALGDSLMAGYDLSESAAFPAQLEKALRAKGLAVEIANAGVSGDTSSGGLARLDWSVPDGTDAVILGLGANDMLRGIAPSVTRNALDETIQRLRARNIEVLLCGMYAPPNMGADFSRAFNPIFPELASNHAVVFYPFFLAGIAANPKYNLRDGMHPNAEGVAMIVKSITPKVEELIARVQEKRRQDKRKS